NSHRSVKTCSSGTAPVLNLRCCLLTEAHSPAAAEERGHKTARSSPVPPCAHSRMATTQPQSVALHCSCPSQSCADAPGRIALQRSASHAEKSSTRPAHTSRYFHFPGVLRARQSSVYIPACCTFPAENLRAKQRNTPHAATA